MATIGRGGITIDEKGTQRVFGYWPEKFKSSTASPGWLGKGFKEYQETSRLIQPLHEQNHETVVANAKKVPPSHLPTAQVREQRARAAKKQLEQIKTRTAAIEREVFEARLKLKAFEYAPNDIVGALNRQELRAHMRGMTTEERRHALRKFEYRRAALEPDVPAEVSGVGDAQRKMIEEEILRMRFPGEMSAIDDANLALELLDTAQETAAIALDNELKASGAQIEEPAPKKESTPWV